MAANFYGRDCEWKGAPCLDGFSQVIGNYPEPAEEKDGVVRLNHMKRQYGIGRPASDHPERKRIQNKRRL